jgi:hypothetical protein
MKYQSCERMPLQASQTQQRRQWMPKTMTELDIEKDLVSCLIQEHTSKGHCGYLPTRALLDSDDWMILGISGNAR